MPLTPNIDEGSSFRGLTEGTNLKKPKQDRGAIQPQHAEVDVFGDPEELVSRLEKIRPGFKNWYQQRQASEADESEKEASSPFHSNRDIFTSDVMNQVRGEREIGAAGMSPANITPGAKAVGKGGTITDEDMNTGAAGSKLNVPGAGMVNNKVAGRPNFYRMRFYGR